MAQKPLDQASELRGSAASLTAVTHRYGSKLALDDVSTALPAGRMTGLIGPDGVGKSTLLALVAGVRRIQTGDVVVLGGDMRAPAYRRSAFSRISYMPQGLGRNLYPTLSVAENIDFFGRLFGQDHEERRWRIEDLTRSTGLNPFLDRPAGKLSGGMKQKLSLCCSLIHDPDLLILDEPTTGVDPLSRRQFWELIDRIRARRPEISIATATAYMEEAAGFEHLIAMDDGRILATGSVRDLAGRSGTGSLEDAFVALLPEERRKGRHTLTVPPRQRRSSEPAIEAEHLTMRFGDFVAVNDVSLRIERGEIFGFLGSNGCGKTTTMKILTGLLQQTSGTARLFGHATDAEDVETRKRVGYMSQSFSLYSELTVRQNLRLHAQLFHIAPSQIPARLAAVLDRFNLTGVADAYPDALSLGVRQRLQLATAVLHGPEVLILDEPTSGVDPLARDVFWQQLIRLSREDGVTIFLSTHFVNEAERCDRVSLMHAGRILAMGTPSDIVAAEGASSLEVAFIDLLKKAQAQENAARPAEVETPVTASGIRDRRSPASHRELAKLWAFARRETLELIRDPIRIAFAVIGPMVLAVAMAFGISFDIENVTYAALDGDQSAESRTFLESFAGSRYFKARPPLISPSEVDRRLEAGDIRVAIMIPPDFGRDLLRGRRPEVAAVLDGSNTFRAETARGYLQGVAASYIDDLARREGIDLSAATPIDVETRFRYNQAFRSRDAISPGVLMMLLIMFSTMLTALGIVREKELGSITNLYAAPVSKFAFLLGKQIPYIGIGLVSFVTLTALIVEGFGVPIRGSFLALALGALVYCCAATAFGLVVSSFVRSQIAAIFGSAIIVTIPTINFSGMMYPVSTLEGSAHVIGQMFPALYFQRISTGVFNKAQNFSALYPNHLMLILFCLIFWGAAVVLLKRQEP